MPLVKCYKDEISRLDLKRNVLHEWAAAPRLKRSLPSSNSYTTTSWSANQKQRISEPDPDEVDSGSSEQAWTPVNESNDSSSSDEPSVSELGHDELLAGLDMDIGTPLQDGSKPAMKCAEYLGYV